MTNLLPPNATALESALADVTSRIDSVPVRARELWNPRTCPAELLPWLAWAVSIDEWNAGWSEQQKRDTIAASYVVHSTKGTIGAVRTSLAALGYQSGITEWWQLPEELDPYTFTADVDTDGSDVIPGIFAETLRVIEQSKNTRSHLARMRIKTKNTAPAYAGAVTLYGGTIEVYDIETVGLLAAIDRWHNTMNFTIPGEFQ